jgi:hypothetical protein
MVIHERILGKAQGNYLERPRSQVSLHPELIDQAEELEGIRHVPQ